MHPRKFIVNSNHPWKTTLGSWMGVDEGSFAADDVLVGRSICAKSDIAFSTGSRDKFYDFKIVKMSFVDCKYKSAVDVDGNGTLAGENSTVSKSRTARVDGKKHLTHL